MIEGLIDVANVMILQTRKQLAEYIQEPQLGCKYSDFVKVSFFKITNNGKDDVEICSGNDELVLSYDAIIPVLKGINVSWGYDKNYINHALKIFDAMDKSPRIMCLPRAAPILIEEDKPVDRQHDGDIVIMIAPRVWD